MLGQTGFSETYGNFIPQRHLSFCESRRKEANDSRSHEWSVPDTRAQTAGCMQLASIRSQAKLWKKKQPAAQYFPYKPHSFFLELQSEEHFVSKLDQNVWKCTGGSSAPLFLSFFISGRVEGVIEWEEGGRHAPQC